MRRDEDDASTQVNDAPAMSGRVGYLDGVRGVAILFVFVWHYFSCQVQIAPTSPLRPVYQALSLTWSGVDLFFVLSGFLITGILLDRRGADNYFRVFYLRRICRIFPLYFLIYGLFLLFLATDFSFTRNGWLFENAMPLWSYPLFIQNVYMGANESFGANFIAMTWSLAVEEQFYLIIPVLIHFLTRKKLVALLTLLVLLAPMLRGSVSGMSAFVLTPFRADSLLLGALLAVAVRWPPFLQLVRGQREVLLVFLAAFSIGAVLLSFGIARRTAYDHLWLSAGYATLILFGFTQGRSAIKTVLESNILQWCGRLSYGLYMFHQPVAGLVHGHFGNPRPLLRTSQDIILTLVSLAITCGLAVCSYHFFEKPILAWGRRREYAKAPAPAAIPATVS